MAKNEIVTQVNEVNRISGGSEFIGRLNSACDIRIDGFFEGRLTTTGKLVIGENAKLLGVVICKSCDIWGFMEGALLVKESFGLRKTGSITGNIACQKIFIEEGATFNGSCKLIDDEAFEDMKTKFK